MFGVLKPCAHGAEKYGIDPGQWQAHMCGLCLGLRDGHGQVARAATNTDAIVLSVLTEAQSGGFDARTTAGPCPLRGMRRASVVDASAPGVRLAATASLLLGTAKIRDHVDDGDVSVLARRPMRRVSGSWAERARTQAAQIGLDVEPMLAAIASQPALEARVAETGHETPARMLDELTGPTQLCAATLFGHTATLAGRPENVAALREIGRHVGRIAHLADAIEDLERDRARGRFNPLDATGTDLPRAYELVRESESRVRRAAAEAELDQLPTVRWALLDPLASLLRALGRGLGIATGHVCRTPASSSAVSAAQQHSPYGLSSPLHKGPKKPGPLEAAGLILGVYCTGIACCSDHTNPCSGKRKQAWRKRCDCCECGDCCGNCGNCGNCGGKDGGCCGCDC
ncbi:regulator [Nocardia mangyaensis]|uniref:Regulator n=1 Tax=Nocardia mangyaensis TaxID=2213200 RepID=A0A1J0W0C3_9NOCA|nr:regulator [Nocardia mangyaensis]